MTTCFHCSRAITGETQHVVTINGEQRPVCCAGCEAAANLIISQGLERFYEFRDPAAVGATARAPQRWEGFDRQSALRRYTHRRSDDTLEISLRIEGLHCAACGWLIESSLARLAGVQLVHVNAASAQTELRFDPQRIALSQILGRIAQLGYDPQPLSWDESAGPNRQRRMALKQLAVAGFGMMAVMTYATSLYAGALQGIAADLEQLLRLVSLVVATPVVLYAAQPFFRGAWRGLRVGTLGMDVPVAVSIAAAYVWSVVCTLRGSGTLYFDSAVMFTFFLLLGRFIEGSLRTHAGLEHEALAKLLPWTTLRLQGERAERVLPSELRAGDRLRILAGERLPADGVVLTGSAQIDESLLTGESQPRQCEVGDNVMAGSMNTAGTFEMSVMRVGPDSTLASISRLLGQARAARPAMSSMVDQVAAWFVAGVLLVAVGTFLYWWHIAPERAFPIALAVLVVTCPCALSLATPAAFAAASTRLARHGLLLTRGRALERLLHADGVVFDKTGTLTQGVPWIAHTLSLSDRLSLQRASAIAAALERHSEHPVAHAFTGLEPATGLSDVRMVAGSGLEGYLDGVRYRLGQEAFVCAGQAAITAAITPADARTPIILGDDHGPLAAFMLSDALRTGAAQAVRQLQNRGLTAMIASGDGAAAVQDIAGRVGIPTWRSGMTAAAKVDLMGKLQKEGHCVVMVGDGINDAPVLAAADVSVAIGSGTDLAKVTADIILLGDSCIPLVEAIDTARFTFRIIRQNLAWAILYNAFAVPLAVSGWLEPWMAAVGMSFSSLVVVLNATRLIRPGVQSVRLSDAAAAACAGAAS